MKFSFKKLLLCVSVFALVLAFAGLSFSAEGEKPVKLGLLSKLNMTQSDFHKFMAENVTAGTMNIFSKNSHGGHRGNTVVIFYDSLIALQLALESGEIDEAGMPESIAEYVMNVNENRYDVSCVVKTMTTSLAMGFRASDDPALRNKINDILLGMKADGTLEGLVDKYILNPGISEPEPVKFDKYENVKENIKVAITGDLPPIDLIASDGTPTGFNTAVLAEIGRRAKINIELVDIDSGARAAALASGRVDAVFWFMSLKGIDNQPDIPSGVVLSESYFDYNDYLHIVKK